MHDTCTAEKPRDRALPFFANADYERVASLLDDLPTFKTKSARNAAAAIVAGMDHHVRMQREGWISYSRSKSHYIGRGIYWGDDYTYGNVVPVIDALHEAGYLAEHERVRPTPAGTGIQSRFIPNASKFQSVRLPRFKKPEGALIRIRDRETKELIPYKMNEAIDREWKWMARMNEAIGDMDIGFSGGIRQDGDIVYFERSAVDLSQQSMYRVYNDTMSLGGRFYGAWWQSVPKAERRQFITLDGQITTEEDYSNQHPKFLYYLVGETLVGDAYDIGEKYHDEMRDPVKRALNIMINAKDYPETLGKTAQYVGGNFAIAKDIIARLKVRHAPIAKFFHSDLGVKLQNVDAAMCRKILDTLTLKKGIPALSIHDSFIVREQDRQVLIDTIAEVVENTAHPILDSVKDSKRSWFSDLHMGSSCSVLPAPASSGAADSDSKRSPQEIQNRNRYSAGARKSSRKTEKTTDTKGSKTMRRFDRIKRKPITETRQETAQAVDPKTETGCPLVATQENAQKQPVERIGDGQASVDTVKTVERAVDPVSRHS